MIEFRADGQAVVPDYAGLCGGWAGQLLDAGGTCDSVSR